MRTSDKIVGSRRASRGQDWVTTNAILLNINKSTLFVSSDRLDIASFYSSEYWPELSVSIELRYERGFMLQRRKLKEQESFELGSWPYRAHFIETFVKIKVPLKTKRD